MFFFLFLFSMNLLQFTIKNELFFIYTNPVLLNSLGMWIGVFHQFWNTVILFHCLSWWDSNYTCVSSSLSVSCFVFSFVFTSIFVSYICQDIFYWSSSYWLILILCYNIIIMLNFCWSFSVMIFTFCYCLDECFPEEPHIKEWVWEWG